MFDNIIRQLITSLDRGSFGAQEKILFFKEIGNLLEGGVGINEAMHVIAENSENFATKEIATNIQTRIAQGERLSKALLAFPKYFDETDIATIQSGEGSGNLGKVLLMIGNEYSYINSLKKRFIGALTYPLILITVAIGAVFALFIFILPSIFEIADQFNVQELPFITRVLKNSSEYLATNGLSVGAVFLFLVFALFVYGSTQTGQKKGFQILMQIPVIGKMIKSYYLIRFSRYFKMLIDSGLNYIVIFKMLKNVISNPLFEPLFDKAIYDLNRGQTIYDSIKHDTSLIPGNVASLIRVGEETATLAHTFDTIIAMYQEELDHYINNLSKLIEPVLLVLIGGVVVVVALGVFGVIMNIMDSVAI